MVRSRRGAILDKNNLQIPSQVLFLICIYHFLYVYKKFLTRDGTFTSFSFRSRFFWGSIEPTAYTLSLFTFDSSFVPFSHLSLLCTKYFRTTFNRLNKKKENKKRKASILGSNSTPLYHVECIHLINIVHNYRVRHINTIAADESDDMIRSMI